MLTIEDHMLVIGDEIIDMPRLARPAVVRAWRVPTEYRENGLFVSVSPDGQPEEVPACDMSLCELIGEARLDAHPDAQLDAAKAEKISEIKRAAAQAIDAMAWRIERAQERDRLGLPGETMEAVMLEREAIRRASNRCEAQIAAALDIAAVMEVRFAVTDADRASPSRITRLQFLRRFTDAEMQAIVAASAQSPALQAEILKWQTADGINLTDPATVSGVNALEIAGLIAPGRAAEILAMEAAS
ncbi:hypothetical protein [Thauera propionica]|uniref:hypothetical protein n=1 Tax=Thauera propionica TaxID=2019431 RepID=UPI0023F4DCD7|nr:hypothetical protein [Thauera propionica]MDD3677189.1 hypothetical protein [Thauera propionica]